MSTRPNRPAHRRRPRNRPRDRHGPGQAGNPHRADRSRRRRPSRSLAQTLADEGATVAHAAVDVTDRDALIRAVAEIAAALGPIDVLVACAGIGTLTQVPELETTMLRQTLDVNLVGVAHSIEAVLPGMITQAQAATSSESPAWPAIAASPG